MFVAEEVLAKHDENYMPPDVADALRKQHDKRVGDRRCRRPDERACMIAELGHFALILAFCLTLPQAFFGLAGAHGDAALDGADDARGRRPVRVHGVGVRVPGVRVLHERFLRAVRRAEFELGAADVLSLRRRLGRARRLAAAVAAGAGDLDARGRRVQSQHAGDDDQPRARRARA